MGRSLVIDWLSIGLILLSFGMFVGYFIGRSLGERFVKSVFDETLNDLEQERKEYQLWVDNGKQPNQVPVPKFGLIQLDFASDSRFRLKQDMGRKIKSLDK